MHPLARKERKPWGPTLTILTRLGAVLPLVSLLAACATVTRGTTDQVTFQSEPTGAQMRTSLGHTCPQTPCTLELPRKQEFIAIFSKTGHEEVQVPVATRVAGAGAAGFAGNILLGGVVGMAADAATGATLEHFPNPVMATLPQLKPVSPIIDRRKRRKATPTS